MEVSEFIASLEKSNFSLAVENGNIILKGDKKKLSKDEISAIKTNRDVIDYIKSNKSNIIKYISSNSKSYDIKKAGNRTAIYRLSGLQQGILFHSLYSEGTGAYIEQISGDLIGLKVSAFQKSWEHILKQHTILRTAFYYDTFNIPVQAVFDSVSLPIQILDYQGLSHDQQEEALNRYKAEDQRKDFDLKFAPLMRIALFQLNDTRYKMFWTFHSILFDGWSMQVILEKFLTTYEALVSFHQLNNDEEDKYEDYIRYIERIDKKDE
ncbi:MAG TPA: condensation domain-containing protein, partial [Segetibacter sp.]